MWPAGQVAASIGDADAVTQIMVMSGVTAGCWPAEEAVWPGCGSGASNADVAVPAWLWRQPRFFGIPALVHCLFGIPTATSLEIAISSCTFSFAHMYQNNAICLNQ